MKEYKVGEIFELNGEIFQCVEDPRDFDCEDCMLCVDGFPCSESSREDGKNVHFVKVTEITEGMLFRADNGKLYRFTTDLKDGEKCSCLIGGYTCSAILRQICSLNPRLWDRLPRERWFVLVDESEKSDGNFESEATPSRRHIEIAVDAVKGGKVTFHIAEQTHRERVFSGSDPDADRFVGTNDVTLVSAYCPQLLGDNNTLTLCVRGKHKGSDDYRIQVTFEQFARIMEAVTEYNLTNGAGYKTPWPQRGDTYYFVTPNGSIDSFTFIGDKVDKALRLFGNFFRTREEAEAAAKRVKKELQAVDAE